MTKTTIANNGGAADSPTSGGDTSATAAPPAVSPPMINGTHPAPTVPVAVSSAPTAPATIPDPLGGLPLVVFPPDTPVDAPCMDSDILFDPASGAPILGTRGSRPGQTSKAGEDHLEKADPTIGLPPIIPAFTPAPPWRENPKPHHAKWGQAGSKELHEAMFGPSAPVFFRWLDSVAYYSMTSPWAMLAFVGMMVASAIPPHVVLAKMRNNMYGSANFIVVMASKSGGGKAAKTPLIIHAGDSGQEIKLPKSVPNGSGAAMAGRYAKMREVQDPNDPARKESRLFQHAATGSFVFPEVDRYAATAGRSGDTMTSELRQFWSGEVLGSETKKDNMNVDGGLYRGTAQLGAQPKKAGALIKDTTGGLLQRLIWMLAEYIPRTDIAPPMLDHAPAVIRMPTFMGTARYNVSGEVIPQNRIIVPMFEGLTQQVRQAQQDHANNPDADDLDTHALLGRLTIATWMIPLVGAVGITEEVWRLAGIVQLHSVLVRAGVMKEARMAETEERLAEGLLKGFEKEGSAAAAESIVEDEVRLILAWAQARPAWTARDRKKATRVPTKHVESALAFLVECGALTVIQGEGTARYVLDEATVSQLRQAGTL